MNLVRLSLGMALAAGLTAGCVNPAEAPQKELAEPEMVQLTDPNPFANYGPAMAPADGFPSAYAWQKANDADLAKAADPAKLRKVLDSGLYAAVLLGKVDRAYASDPRVLVGIAAITQYVMRPDDPQAAADRARWVTKLLDAAKHAPDAYRKLFFLDQLRWCGRAEDAPFVRLIGKLSADKAVKEFAEQVAGEISR